MHPEDLLHPSRLDVVVKYLYLRSLTDADPDPDAGRLYDAHIARRTGGWEDAKRSVTDYRQAAARLLHSIDTRGFDARKAIPVGRNGLPRNGAHRLAACLALGRQVAVSRSVAAGPEWDFEWFRTHGFTPADLDVIIRTYVSLSTRAIAFICWSPTIDAWPAIVGRLASHAPVVGWRDLTFDAEDVPSLVHDVYAYAMGPKTGPRIEHKARSLARMPPRVRLVIADPGCAAAQDGLAAWAAAVKADLRRLAGRGPDDFFDTVHATDSAAETRYLVNLLLHDNTRRLRIWRRGRVDRPEFLAWLDTYRSTLATRGIDRDDACVVGSAVLEAVGLREATDIDCIVTDRIRSTWFHQGIVALAPQIDLVTAGYHRRSTEAATVPDDRIIDDPRRHFLYRGLKFANPEIVIDRKRQQGRPKDCADVALWHARHAQAARPASSPDRCVVFWDPTPIDPACQARWQNEAARLRQLNVQTVIAGPTRTPACFDVPCIEAPTFADDLPAGVLTDPDPIATLAALKIEPAHLLEVDQLIRRATTRAEHAIDRLSLFACFARWTDQWMASLRPDVFVRVEPHPDVAADIAEAIARHHGVAVVSDVAQIDATIAAMPLRNSHHHRATDDACRVASEWTRLVSRAAEGARLEALSARHAELVGETERLRATVAILMADRQRRDIWIWGAGSAGQRAAAWLISLGILPRGIIDSDGSKWGHTVANARVEAPSVLRQALRERRPFVVVASIHAAAIVEQLTRFNLSDSDVVVAPPLDHHCRSAFSPVDADRTNAVERRHEAARNLP